MHDNSWKKFVAAAVQAAPVLPLSKKGTTEKVLDLMSQAAREGARLMVFPETFIPAYPNFSVDLQNPNEWQENLRYLLSESVFVPGEEIDRIAKHARDLKVYISIGVNERVKTYGGRLYNTQVFIGSHGRVIGSRRKLLPTNREKVFWTPGDGADLQVYETELGVIGSLICYEHLQPLFKYALMVRGEQVHCAAWPGWPSYKKGRTNKHVIDVSARQYALEGQCFVVISCMYVSAKDVPAGLFGNAAWAYFGGSGIVNPAGEYVAGPEYDKETIVFGEIDLSINALRKSLVDITGKDQRWDVIQLAWKGTQTAPFLQPAKPATEGAIVWDTRELEEQVSALKEEVATLRGIVEGMPERRRKRD
ncbi:MAG: carbon-nitrogen hydrolase family protein [Deltaproteobacteria bacterium]|nr:carbon-nitrogen hydrolase family protein [Deltaproteobacteria bacterium]